MKKEEFIRKFLELAEELHYAEGFKSVVVVDEIRRLYDEHFEEVQK